MMYATGTPGVRASLVEVRHGIAMDRKHLGFSSHQAITITGARKAFNKATLQLQFLRARSSACNLCTLSQQPERFLANRTGASCMKLAWRFCPYPWRRSDWSYVDSWLRQSTYPATQFTQLLTTRDCIGVTLLRSLVVVYRGIPISLSYGESYTSAPCLVVSAPAERSVWRSLGCLRLR
jgi:hypothetical protein